MLEDLNNLITSCRHQFDNLPFTSDLELNKDIAEKLESTLPEVEDSTDFIVHPFSIQLRTKDNLRADIPSSWLWFGSSYWSLSKALEKYKQSIRQIEQALKDKGYKTPQIKEYLKNLPSPDWQTVGDPNIARDFSQEIDNLFPNANEKDLFVKFVSDRDWWIISARETEAATGKNLSRTDVYDSALALACRVVVSSSSKLLTIIKAFSISPDLRQAFTRLQKNQQTLSTVTESRQDPAENVIYYGAPGSGKSYKIEEECDEQNSYRTIFHPDTQYSDFVGCLRPFMNDDKVFYQFRPGPFTNALIKAKNTTDHFYLVIEEINRASAAAVFGEIFQLLDRTDSGESKYTINLSDADMIDYIQRECPSAIEEGKIRIPSNLSLLATMNSSDQAVMPMDTAFKRRWRFEYVPIDFKKCPKGNFLIPLTNNNQKLIIEWAAFAQIINDVLEQHDIPEDRLLGPWFLTQNELKDEASSLKALKGKLLLYLWDDVLRHSDRSIVFKSDIKSFGSLATKVTKKEPIFNQSIESQLESAGEFQEVSSTADGDSDNNEQKL